jgi:glutathione synthase/RimK-type ligase-like ATP-grasp enzyme
VHFHVYGLPVAQTVFITPAVVRNLDKLSFGFPCIMKATNGSHGNFNYKLQGSEEVERVLTEDEGKHTFVLQRFMPNDCDFRILVAGNEVMVIKRSALGDSHLNNTSKGGDAELVDPASLPAAIIAQARDIVQKIGMTVAGVDVLYDQSTGNYSFLEVNSQPQLMTGAFVDEKAELMGAFFGSLVRQRAE